jgi:N-acetyl-gamma-glutamyl-phosphate reductase common form
VNKFEVIIVGGTGFGAGELLRLLLNHPNITVNSVISSSNANKPISSSHPHLLGLYDHLNFISSLEEVVVQHPENAVFICALPHGQSAATVEKINLKFPKSRIIDLSGDLRLKDLNLHKKFYPSSELSENLRQSSVYGLPELNFELIKQAKIISNPGCLATAAILSLLPVSSFHSSIRICANSSIVLNVATGSSGAGKEPKQSTHHPVRHANFFSYKPFEHQHEPEIQQTLTSAGLSGFTMSFVPHSLPISRGILCATYFNLTSSITAQDITAYYKKYYANSPFIRVLQNTPAEIENIVGSNFCDVSVATRDNQVVVTTVIDNLVKGMAGQAIENLNIMTGLDRMTGLRVAGLRPI